ARSQFFKSLYFPPPHYLTRNPTLRPAHPRAKLTHEGAFPKPCLPKRKLPPTAPTRNYPPVRKPKKAKPPLPAIAQATASPTATFSSSSPAKTAERTASCS